jgi:hypothetical protein
LRRFEGSEIADRKALFLGIAAARVPGMARGSAGDNFREAAAVVGDVILVLVPGEQRPKAGFLCAVIALVVIDRRNPFLYGQPIFGEETVSDIATFLHKEAAPSRPTAPCSGLIDRKTKWVGVPVKKL